MLIRADGLGLISKKEAEAAGLLPMEKSAYEIAKSGGDYSKFYERYQSEYLPRLQRAVKSYDKVIVEHEKWIRNPSLKLGTDASPEVVRRYAEDKWPRDIARNLAYKSIIKGIIEERKNGKPD